MNPADPRCPECGASVHLNAAGCRHCGARRGPQGWERSETYDGLDLPGEDDDFDYDEFVAREFGDGPKSGWAAWPAKKKFWWLVALVTFLAFAWLAMAGILMR
ncbi:MAG: hypothetical protein KDM64_01310 [Verrucomicrobiae bacterium]|nr:hypothetical protein [Verrucomicrobiae bacterium]